MKLNFKNFTLKLTIDILELQMKNKKKGQGVLKKQLF